MTSDVAGTFLLAGDPPLAGRGQLSTRLRANAEPPLLLGVRFVTILLELHTVVEHDRPGPRRGWHLTPPVPGRCWGLA